MDRCTIIKVNLYNDNQLLLLTLLIMYGEKGDLIH